MEKYSPHTKMSAFCHVKREDRHHAECVIYAVLFNNNKKTARWKKGKNVKKKKKLQ